MSATGSQQTQWFSRFQVNPPSSSSSPWKNDDDDNDNSDNDDDDHGMIEWTNKEKDGWQLNNMLSQIPRGGVASHTTKRHPSESVPPPPPPKEPSSTNDRFDNAFFSSLFTIPSFPLIIKSFLGITISLYILNQKHMLPKPLSRVVSQCLFWPTLPITMIRRINTPWETIVDDTVVMGGAPFGFLNKPEQLYHQFGVRGVINLCEEYKGPIKQYEKLGITSLYLPTVDHFEPSVPDLELAVQFIQQYVNTGTKVYVHCRAGHGRSAAVVMGWLLSNQPKKSLFELNQQLSSLRNVRKKLWKQPNLRRLQARLLSGTSSINKAKNSDDNDDGDDTTMKDSLSTTGSSNNSDAEEL